MNTQKIILGLTVAAVLVISGYLVTMPSGTTTYNNPPIGAASGPDIPSRYLRVGGLVHEYRYSNQIQLGTSTVCSFAAPSATSTLVNASFRLGTATNTALQIFVAKGATPNATTTRLFSANNAANALTTIMATTSTDNFVITPSVTPYINFNVAGGPTKAGVDALFASEGSATGSCSAEFVSLP